MAGLDYLEGECVLVELKVDWVVDALLSLDIALSSVGRCISGEQFEQHPNDIGEADPEILTFSDEEKRVALDRAWTAMELERERLMVLLNGGKVNLMEATWLIRESLYRCLEQVCCFPDKAPASGTEEASRTCFQCGLAGMTLRKTAEHLLRQGDGQGIPSEHRSSGMSKAEAAAKHAGHRVSNPTDYFANKPDIKIEGGPRVWYFDIRDFPDDAEATMNGLAET